MVSRICDTITTITNPMGYQSDTYFIATTAPIPQTVQSWMGTWDTLRMSH